MSDKSPKQSLPKFAVLQLSGCAGCEVSLINASEWIDKYQLVYMPLVVSTHTVPKDTEILLVSGGVRNDEDIYNLRRSVEIVDKVIAVGTCAISGGVANLGDRSSPDVSLPIKPASPTAPPAKEQTNRCIR